MDSLELSKDVGIIIQCRDRSTRMKFKSVRPFFEKKSILQILIERFKHLPFPLIVATTRNSSKTIKICIEQCIPYYIGDEDNVLSRLYEAANEYNLKGFFRVCADNPFVSLPLMFAIVLWRLRCPYDYIAFEKSMQRHEGFWLEYIKTDALYKIIVATEEPRYLEHVTLFITEHPWLFTCKTLPVPTILLKTKIRLTVDTKNDFNIAQSIYKKVGENWWQYIRAYIQAHPRLLEKMKKNIEANPK